MSESSRSRESRPQAELSRPVEVMRLGDEDLVTEIVAGPAERAALAERFGLLGLARLEARITLRRLRGGAALRLEGHLSAAATQACVVTLEPVDSRIEQDFAQSFTIGAAASPEGEVVVEPEGEEPPEPIGPQGLDLGEVVAQQLAVALDPYPRAPSAALAQSAWGAAEEEEGQAGATDSPFAVLRDLNRRG